jgi:predicted nucleic acid-binding protein
LALKSWLVDTGPFVAYFDRADPMHLPVATALDLFSGQLLTTDAVITEVMYFLSDLADGPAAFAELLLACDARVEASTQPEQVRKATELMKKYADTPMDFADATLVLAAGQTGILDVLTLDRRGFSTYRTPKNKRLRLVLEGQRR